MIKLYMNIPIAIVPMSISPFDPNYIEPKEKINDHKHAILSSGKTVECKASLFGIKEGNVSLRLGRYNKFGFNTDRQIIGEDGIKQGLSVNNDELNNLINFINTEYQPLNLGLKNYIPIEGDLSQEKILALQKLFSSDKKEKLAELLDLYNIIPEDITDLLELKKRQKAITDFETNMKIDVLENIWQNYFNQNKWIFHTELINILDDRRLDVSNTVDYLVKAPDGFVDIIELKRYKTSANFWSSSLDHHNYVPHSDLVKAITQCQNYLFSVERQMNSVELQDRIKCKIVKPRITLVFGSSFDWDEEKWQAFRILNSSYHSLSITTYDILLQRCKNLVYAPKN